MDVSEHVLDSETLPTYRINKPKPEFMQILDLLNRNGGTMEKHQIIRNLEENHIIKKSPDRKGELSAPAKHSRLRSLLDPMTLEWNLISTKTNGRRSEVSIESQGETALRIFGLESK